MRSQHRKRSIRDRIKVFYQPLRELRLNPKNPRLHSPRQIRQIAQSIEAFGFNVPILIDRDLEVIVGHGRVFAAHRLHLERVPTIRLDHLTEAQAKAFMIADNRLTENSLWDEQLLGEQLRELSVLDLDFSLEATGFEMGEIDLKIEGLTSPSEKEDAVDEMPNQGGQRVSTLGDLWLLGGHRVYCGNALDGGSYSVLMNGRKATAVISDPPYNVRISGNVSGLGAIKHREFAMASGEMTEEEFIAFLVKCCSLFARHSNSGSLHFLFIDWRHIGELLAAGRQVYSQFMNLAVWAKNTPGMGSFYRSQHELVFVFRSGKEGHRNNIQLGRFGRNRSNLWSYPSINSFGRKTEEGDLLALHPTVKPAALLADVMLDCTARGDIVLDGFLGSGTTVIAAERTGRHCYGLEIDPTYVDCTVRRWQALTRDAARHASSGKTFGDVQAERGARDEETA